MRISDWSSDVCSSDLCAGALRPGQRHRHPRIGQRRRQALAEYGDVPGAVDVEAEIALADLVPDVGDRGVAHTRRPAIVEDSLVERQRAPEALAAEVPVAAAVAPQRGVDGRAEEGRGGKELVRTYNNQG